MFYACLIYVTYVIIVEIIKENSRSYVQAEVKNVSLSRKFFHVHECGDDATNCQGKLLWSFFMHFCSWKAFASNRSGRCANSAHFLRYSSCVWPQGPTHSGRSCGWDFPHSLNKPCASWFFERQITSLKALQLNHVHKAQAFLVSFAEKLGVNLFWLFHGTPVHFESSRVCYVERAV